MNLCCFVVGCCAKRTRSILVGLSIGSAGHTRHNKIALVVVVEVVSESGKVSTLRGSNFFGVNVFIGVLRLQDCVFSLFLCILFS